jgi:hypothetical protein
VPGAVTGEGLLRDDQSSTTKRSPSSRVPPTATGRPASKTTFPPATSCSTATPLLASERDVVAPTYGLRDST